MRFTEGVDGLDQIPHALSLLDLIQIQNSPGDGSQAKAPVEGHQWIDPKDAAPGAGSSVMVAVLAIERRQNRGGHDARAIRHGLEHGLHRFSIQANFWHLVQQGEASQESTLARQVSDRFQCMGMTDPVKAVHTEAEANKELVCHVKFIHGGNTGDVFFRRAQPGFIASHQTIGSAVNQNNGIGLKMLYDCSIAFEQRLAANLFEAENRHLFASSAKPLREVEFREISTGPG